MFKVPDWGNDVPKSDMELTKLFGQKNNKKNSKRNTNAIDNRKIDGKKKNVHGIEKCKNKFERKIDSTKKLTKLDHIKQRMLKRNLKILNVESKSKHNSETSLNKELLQKGISHANKSIVIHENSKSKINLTHKSNNNEILQDNVKTVGNKNKKPRKRKHPQIDKKPSDPEDSSLDVKNSNTEESNKVLINTKRKKHNAKIQNNDVEATPLGSKQTANGKTAGNHVADNSCKKNKNQNKNSIGCLNEVESDKGNEMEISNKERKIRKKKEQLKEILKKNVERNMVHTNGSKLRIRMMERLKAAQFRYINEKLYTSTGEESQELFRSDPTAFQAYHEGYRQQVKKWPVNPLDLIVKRIQSMPKTHVIADMGCGEAELSRRVGQRVHSIDLVAAAPGVLAADMARTPLLAASVDVAVYCLALMGTDLTSYLLEANRVLRIGGHLLIAEVESRFENAEAFSGDVQRLGFSLKKIDKSHQVFFFLEFTKVRDAPTKKHKLPVLSLKPCLYKKR